MQVRNGFTYAYIGSRQACITHESMRSMHNLTKPHLDNHNITLPSADQKPHLVLFHSLLQHLALPPNAPHPHRAVLAAADHPGRVRRASQSGDTRGVRIMDGVQQLQGQAAAGYWLAD